MVIWLRMVSLQPTHNNFSGLWPSGLGICNSYTMAAGAYVSKIPSSCDISDVYHLGRTHLIGDSRRRTNENSSHLFYTVASED